MRVVLNKGKWFLLALFVFVLPFGVARANSFASQGDTLQCVQVETDTSGDRSGDDYRLATATSTTVECGETSVAGSSLGDRFGDSDISHRLATASTSEPATSEGQDGYCSCIYWDPVNGSDAYNGFYSSEPVKSASMAISWHEQYSEFGDDPIYLMSTGTITANTTWDFGGAPVRAYTSFGNMFEINGAYTLTIKNATLVGPGTSSSYYAVYSSYSGAKVVLENCTFSNFSSDYPISVPSSGTLTEVYWDPTSGVDTNDGSSSSAAVKSAGKAKSLLANVSTGTIYLTSAYTLTASTTWDFGGATVKKTFAGDMFTASSAYTLTISNGKFVGGGTSSQGRAIYTSNSSATIDLTDCTFSNFYKAHADGGAIYSGGTLNMKGCTFSGNFIYGGNAYGGAIYAQGSGIEMTGCTFSENYLQNSNNALGGAIYCNSALTATDCKFEKNYTNSTYNNSANYSSGGAIQGSSTITLTDCEFSGNYNKGGSNLKRKAGGAVYLENSSLSIYGCTFSGNYTGTDSNCYGGAVYCYKILIGGSDKNATTTFTGNTSYYGGTIYSIGNTSSGTTIFKNCTIKNSTGSSLIYLAKSTNYPEFTNCIFQNNTVTTAMIYGVASSAKITFSGGTYGGSSTTGNTLNLASGSTGAVICYATGSGATITIKGGTYTYNTGGKLFDAPNGSVVKEYGTFGNNTNADDNVSISAVYWDPTSGNDSNDGTTSSTPVKSVDKAKSLIVNSTDVIYLTSAYTLTANTTWDFGGATVKKTFAGDMFTASSAYTLTISNGKFVGGGTSSTGRAICTSNSSAKTILTNCTFSDFYKSNDVGGAIYSSGTLDIDGCTFTGNHVSANGTGGGAIFCSSTLDVKNCTFKNNYTYSPSTSSGRYSCGGAIFCRDTTNLTDCVFIKNYADGAGDIRQGGAVNASSALNIYGCTFQSNDVGDDTYSVGGAIYCDGALTIQNSDKTYTSFSGNTAKSGGAIYSNGSTATIDCVVWYSTGENLIALAKATTINFINCAFQNNTVTQTMIYSTASSANITFSGGTYGGSSEKGNTLNLASGSTGAVICYATGSGATITVNSGTYTYNSGGRLFLAPNGTVTINDGSFYGNSDPADNYLDIYWDPVNGNDSNNGKFTSKPVKSFSRARALVTSDDMTIRLVNVLTLASNTTLDFGNRTMVLAKGLTGNGYIYVNGAYALTMANVTISTETTTASDTTIPVVKGSGSSSTLNLYRVNFQDIYSTNYLLSNFSLGSVAGVEYNNVNATGISDFNYTGVCYWDPTNGDDSNLGIHSGVPVKTYAKAKEIAGTDGKILMCGQQSITSSTTMNFEGRTIYLAKGVTDIDAFFYITGAYTVTFTNVTFSTETKAYTDVTVPVIVGTSASSTLKLTDTVSFTNIYTRAKLIGEVGTIEMNGTNFSTLIIAYSTAIGFSGTTLHTINAVGINVDNVKTNNNFFYLQASGSEQTVNESFTIKDSTINNLNQCSFVGGNSWDNGKFENLTISNCSFVDGVYSAGFKNLEVVDCTIIKNSFGIACFTDGYANTTATFTNCTFGGSEENANTGTKASYGSVFYYNAGADSLVTVNGGEFSYNNGGSLFLLAGNRSSIVINSGKFHHNKNSSVRKAYAADGTVAKDCVFGAIVGAREKNGTTFYKHNITINDGTFNDNYTCAEGGVVANCGNSESITTINDGEFYNNISKCEGGVVYTYGSVYIYGGHYKGNKSNNYYGGAIACCGNLYIDSTKSSSDIIFEENGIKDVGGGAIIVWGSNSFLDIKGGYRSTVKFINNKAAYGGAIEMCATGTIVGTKTNPIVFINNTSVGTGGAICVYNPSETKQAGLLTLVNCIFTNDENVENSGNKAGTLGGAVRTTSTLRATGCTFNSSTSVGDGGAIYARGNVSLEDCIFTSNDSGSSNGATAFTEGSMSAKGCEFTGNTGRIIFRASINMTLVDCIATNNTTSTTSGGGHFSCAGKLVVTNCDFSDNKGQSADASAICACAGGMELKDCTFTNNTSIGTNGSAVACLSGQLFVDNCTFTNNSSERGGAIYGAGTVTITNSTFTENSANSSAGGAVYSGGAVTIDNCSFEKNSSTNSGGAIFGYAGGITVTDSKFIDNKSGYNGGSLCCGGGGIVVKNCTFTNNLVDESGNKITTASANGGAIFSGSDGVDISNSSFTNFKTSGSGGAVYSNAKAILTDTTFTGNEAGRESGAVHTLSTVTITGCTFTKNSSTSDGAGAMRAQCGTIANSDFIENKTGGRGGAIYFNGNISSSHTTFDYCTFSKNTADNIGGTMNILGEVTINNCEFEGITDGNSANKGAFISAGDYSVTINNSNFSNATAPNGCILTGGGTITLNGCNLSDMTSSNQYGIVSVNYEMIATNCTFTNMTSGGNKYSGTLSGQNITATNCTFTNCVSSFRGGAIEADLNGGSGSVTATNCKFLNCNTTSIIYTYGTSSSITDCTFQNNTVSVAMVVSIADSASLTFNGGTYGGSSETGNTFDGTTGAVVCYVSGSGATITVNGGEYSYNTGAVLFSAPNGTVTINTIYSHDNSHDNKDTLKRVYWDPTSGNDTYAGTSTSVPVKTWAVVLNKISLDGNGENVVYGSEIYLCGVMTISATTTYDFKNSTIILCKGITGTAFFYVNGAYTLTLQNATITTETTTQSDTTIPVAKGTSSATLTMTNVNFENFYTSANVVDTFSYVPVSNMKAENVQGSANFFYSANNITLSGSSFIDVFVGIIVVNGNGTATMGDTIFKNCGGNHLLMSRHSVFIESGTTIDSCYGNSLFWMYGGSSVTINGGTFKNNWSIGSNFGGVLVTLEGASASITVNDGEFSNNKNGSLFLLYGNNSNIDIMDGNFHDNRNEKVKRDTSSTSDFVKNCNYGTIVGSNYNNTHNISIYGGNFYNNYSIDEGGAIFNGSSGNTTISGGRFFKNNSKAHGTITSYTDTVVTGGYFYSNGAGSSGSCLAVCDNLTIDSSNSTADIIFKECASYPVYIWGCNKLTIISGTKYTVKFIESNGAITTNGSVYINNNATTEVLPVIFRGNWGNNYHTIATSDTRPGDVVAKYCRFENNQSANGNGGAIYGTKTVTLENCTFKGNKAYKNGGAVYSASTCTVTNCEFIGNTAGGSGGAIYLPAVTLAVTDCEFIGNTAKDYGGAIGSQGAITIKSENMATRFVDNKATSYDGGAIHNNSTSVSFVASEKFHLIFDGNTAGTDGGSIGLEPASNISVTWEYCDFSNGSAAYGGHIYASNVGMTFKNCTFDNSTASKRGGAVTTYNTINATNCTFKNATCTGTGSGGAIMCGKKLTAINCDFIECKATALGGGVVYSGTSVEAEDCDFVGNESAGSGGAICAETTVKVTNCDFIGNTAGASGGAIFAKSDCTATNCNFIGNTAKLSSGGGICASSGVVTVENCDFVSNQAKYSGAAIRSKKVEATDCQFEKNEADASGGAIYNYGGPIDITNCDFIENKAYGTGRDDYGFTRGGGAIKSCGSSDKNYFTNCNFIRNFAQYEGGAINISSDNTIVLDCNFIENEAKTDNGGAIAARRLTINATSQIVFKGNKCKTGGAIDCTVLIVNGTSDCPVIFEENSGIYSAVGHIWVGFNLNYCIFKNNYSQWHGVLTALGSWKNIINNCVFENNELYNGGCIRQYYGSETSYNLTCTFTFTNCEFKDNFAGRGGVFGLNGGTANLSFSGCTFSDSTGADVLEEGQTTKLGDKMNGAIVYVGGKATVNLSGLSFENFETKGVGLFYVANGGTLNYSNSILYNTRTTYGLIYNLGTANLTNLTIAGCNGSAIGPLYCGGSGVMTVTNLSTTYTSNSVTTKGNKNDYGGTLAIGEIYDTEGKALLMSNGNALTVAGGTVEFVSGEIVGDGYEQQTVTAAKKGGGVYAGKGGKFNMYGGIIKANWGGTQLYIEGGEANVYGVNKYDYTNRKVETGAGAMIFHARDGNWSVGVFDAGVLNLLGGYIYKVEVYSGGKMTALGGSTSQTLFYEGSEAKLKNMVLQNGGAGYNYSYNRNQFYSDKVEFVNCYIRVLDSSSYNYFVSTKRYASIKFTDCVFEECQAKGTIKSSKDRPSLFRNTGGTIEFEGCEFLNGKDTLFYSHPDYSTSKYIFNNCTLNGNKRETYSTSWYIMMHICNGSVEMYDTNFVNNTSYIDLCNNATLVVDGCEFSGSKSASLWYYGIIALSNNAEASISSTVFKDLYSAGHGAAIMACNSAIINLDDCSFINNTSAFHSDQPAYSGKGGAIYMRSAGTTLNLEGEIRVENNSTYLNYESVSGDSAKRDEFAPSGGGIYVADSATFNIKQNTLLICKDNYREVEQSDGTTIKYADNLYIASSNKMILEGDLNEGSDFGLGCVNTRDSENQIVLEEKDALLSKGENYPVTNKLLGMASSDNENYELRFVYLKDNKNGLVFYPKERSTYWLLCNDLVVDYDPAKTQTINTPTLMYGNIEYANDYRIKYLNENGEYKLDKPTFTEIGSYAVQYIVECLNEKLEWTTLTVDGVAMTGKTYLRILGTRLILEEYPVAHLDYGKTLAYAKFYGGVVKDAEGQTVTGVWEFVNSDTVGENGKSYVAKFTPSNTINVMESSIQMLQNVSVEVQTLYPYVFYQKGYFRTKLNGDSSTIINITDLQTMVDNMPDNGTLVFCETYTISSNQTIEVEDKSINFVRYRLFKYSIDSSGNYSSTGDPMPMIAVDGVDASLTLKGNIYFEGLAPYSGWWNFNISSESDSLSHIKNYALIEVGKSGNGGSLTLGEGVVIRNWGVKIDTANVGLITIYANASAELDGCEIYGNRIIVQDGFNSSVITNNGTLNIKNGKFMNNILVDGSKYATNRTSVGVTATPFGKGGFLVCNTGSTTVIDGGEIYSNRAQYGGAIYVNTNATLTLNGGQIYANRGYTSGGAIYLEADTTMTVGSSCEISGNMSGGNSAIVFNDSTQATVTVVDASGTGVSGASAMLMLNSIDEQNQSFVNFALIDGVETTVASDQSVVNMTLLFSGLCLMFVCIVARRFHIKKQRKFSKK